MDEKYTIVEGQWYRYSRSPVSRALVVSSKYVTTFVNRFGIRNALG